jgi:hypothetical protein
MPLGVKVLIIVVIAAVAVMVLLYFLGKRAEKKKDEQQAQINAAAQNVTMLIIDKKKMRLKDAGLPQLVLEQTPKRMHRAKVPIVKAKVGPKIMTLICEAEIFDLVPVKKEVKATVSGLYLTNVKGIRGSLEAPVKKKGVMAKLREKAGI